MTGPLYRDPSIPASNTDVSSGSSGIPVASTGKPVPVKRRRRGRRFLLTFLLLVVVVGALWTWISVTFPYANGETRGYVQNLTRRGWVCKTWEGELSVMPIPGTTVNPHVFAFTVRDNSVAAALERASGQLVALQYGQHRGVPSTCFGETPVYVTGFRIVP